VVASASAEGNAKRFGCLAILLTGSQRGCCKVWLVRSVPLSIAGCFVYFTLAARECELVLGAGFQGQRKEGFMERRGQKERRRRTSKCRRLGEVMEFAVVVERTTRNLERRFWAIRDVEGSQAISG